MDSQQVLTIAGGGLLTLLIVCGAHRAGGAVRSVWWCPSSRQPPRSMRPRCRCVPKLLAAFATLGLAGPWMLSRWWITSAKC